MKLRLKVGMIMNHKSGKQDTRCESNLKNERFGRIGKTRKAGKAEKAGYRTVTKLLIMLTVILLGNVLACADTNSSSADQPQRLLIIGDSLSSGYNMKVEEGWVALLEERLADKEPPWTIINASISGETTRQGLRKIDTHLSKADPTWVILELGGNDALRGTQIPAIKKNLAAMIEKIQAIDANVLIAGVRLPPNYGPIYTSQFTNMYRDLADEYDILVVPYMLEGVSTEPSLMQKDQIHPNVKAQPFILENIWKVFRGAVE